MSRAVIAIMAGLLCALAGLKHAAALKADAARMARWGQLLRHLALLLREGSLSIPEALCAAANRADPPDRLLQAIATQIADAPMTTLAEAFQQKGLHWPEHDVLLRLFSHLGRGTKAQRLLAVEQAADEMHLLGEAAGRKAEKDVRLWQTLGFAGGACLTILLL